MSNDSAVPHCQYNFVCSGNRLPHRPAQPLEGRFLCLVKYNLTVRFNLCQVPSHHLFGKQNKDLAFQANVFHRASITTAYMAQH